MSKKIMLLLLFVGIQLTAQNKKWTLEECVDYAIKNNTFVFRNIIGGVSALVDGKVQEITNMKDAEYSIYGNKVLVLLFNKTSIVYSEGRKYTN